MISRLRKLLWQSAGLESGGYTGGWSVRMLLTTLTASLGAVLVLPLLLMEALRGTLPLEGDSFWGLCYQHLLLALLFVSVLVVMGLGVRLRAQPWVGGAFVVAGLFCAWPFFHLLRENLSLAQLLLGQPQYSNWPFYLQPLHLLVEGVLPVAIFLSLLLAVRDFFGQERRGYAALARAVFLLVAFYLGWVGLLRTGQPTLLARLGAREAVVAPQTSPLPAASVAVTEKMLATPTAVERQPSAPPPPAAGEAVPPVGPSAPVPAAGAPTTGFGPGGEPTPVDRGQPGSASGGVDSPWFRLQEQVEQLQGRVERLEARFEQMAPVVPLTPSGEPSPGRSAAPRAEEELLNGIHRQLESLTAKVEQLGAKLGPAMAPRPLPNLP